MSANSLVFFLIFLINASYVSAQSLAINTDGSLADNSAILDIKSAEKGMLIPRMSKTDRNAIASAAQGLLVFQNSPDSIGFYYYNGIKWHWLVSSTAADSSYWTTGGNSNINAGTFIGTLNDSALRFRIRNTPSGILDSVKSNTALGFKSLKLNNNGQANTAFGYTAMESNTNGTANTGIGAFSLSAVTTGNYNTAVGQAALNAHQTLDGNTAIGAYALQFDVNGYSNTAIGLFSMYQNNNGFYNTAVGRESLKKHTTSNYNTAIGSVALINDLSGTENTAVGYNAFAANTTGNFNTALGSNTNLTANNLTNASAIGHRAMVGQSNSIVLGSILGVNSATADTRVGIGTTTPQAILDANGVFKLGRNGTVNTEWIKLSVSKDIASINANSSGTETFAVANVQAGSAVYISPENALPDGILIAYARVSAANVVEVKFSNTTASAIDVSSMNYYISVVR